MQIIQFDSSIPSQDIELTIGDVLFFGRLYYRERLNGWYIDLYWPDEEPFVLGRRLTPGYGPFLGLSLPGNLPATLFVLGRVDYEQEDLGTGLLEAVEVFADELDVVDLTSPFALTVELD
jgi:hypothetical protein